MPKARVDLRFDSALLAAVDKVAGPGRRTAFIEDACRARLEAAVSVTDEREDDPCLEKS